MLDNASLKFLLAAALAFFVLFAMSRKRTDSFAPFAWYGKEGGESGWPEGWGAPITPRLPQAAKRENYNAGLVQDPVLTAAGATAMAPQATSADLLPKTSPDAGFGQFAPDPAALTGQNFVDASRWVSVGTLGTHRNANYQLRADIPIPKNNAVSPWQQSTIEQDTYRKPLE
jgi:hypothetical protein